MNIFKLWEINFFIYSIVRISINKQSNQHIYQFIVISIINITNKLKYFFKKDFWLYFLDWTSFDKVEFITVGKFLEKKFQIKSA